MRVVVLLVLFGWGSLYPLMLGLWMQNNGLLRVINLVLKENLKKPSRAYQKSIDQNPKAPVAHYNLGIAYKNLRQLDKAAVVLEKAVELAPSNLDIRLTLGNIYNMQERWKDAIGQLNIVVHRQRNDAQAHGNLGWAYYNYKEGPPFKQMVILNLSKAVELFKKQNQLQAAESTRKILEEAKIKFGYQAAIP